MIGERQMELIESEGEKGKREGMALAAEHHQGWLAQARRQAVQVALANPNRTCSVNDLILPGPAGNWVGSIFKGGEWEFTGMRVRADRPESHAREVKVWRLK